MALKLLDLFCGAGGASCGYAMAGFEVTGVDCAPQPRYPYRFVRANALELSVDWLQSFDLVHASPPCQRWSAASRIGGDTRRRHADLLTPVRRVLLGAGVAYVIENVPGAPLHGPVMLCGQMFGLPLLRHRLFECGGFRCRQPNHPPHPVGPSTAKLARRRIRPSLKNGAVTVSVYGGGNKLVAEARVAMQIGWMTRDELNEAIPPAYAHYVGLEFLRRSK